MRFKGLDLNLLVAFDALVTQGNLTTAARSINLSQPAMSAAVARLRTYFRDELFTMRGRKLVPTPRAEALAAPIREALAHIQLSIISPDDFNPSQSNRRFRIILSDFMTVVFFRRIVDRVAREAPRIRFELLPPSEEPDELLRRGEVDFLMYPEMFMSSAHPKAALFEDTFVCVGCPSNKQLASRLTFENYMSIGHVEAQFGRFLRPSFREWLLLEHGFKIRTEVAVQGFGMIPPMLLGTNRIASMPSRLVSHFANTMPLRVVEPPLRLLTFTEAVQWPAIHNTDPASIWMRNIFFQEASTMVSPPETSQFQSPL
ncbi:MULTISPECIES: LysR family transcriptional regulator [unclassified Bradyrhizobium]|uniref:LysR family transcriptional regulator n=1 Tax=unclassified Bradyrhizobium TaxID=2631580 RepID=UPI003398D49D